MASPKRQKTIAPQAPQKASWRDVLPIHPAAVLFPMMSPDELRELGEDIKKHKLHEPITLWFSDPDGNNNKPELLDGRNRLDAMEADGISVVRDDWKGGGIHQLNVAWKGVYPPADPYAYVISANIIRRHITTTAQRIKLVEDVIKLNPLMSSRRAAKLAGVSPTTGTKARKRLEAKGDVSTVDTSIDTKGRRQPAHKPAHVTAAVERGKTKGPVASRRAASEDQEIEEGFKQFAGDLGAALGCKVGVVGTKGRQQPAKHKPKPPAGNDVSPQESADRCKAEAQTDLEDFTPKSAMNRSAATELWTDDQLKRKAAAESGLCVVANLHKGADEALIAWAKAHGRFVQIDRKTDWGNYFEEGEDGTRDEVVAKYAEFCLPNKNGLLAKLPTLRGMVLGCWCHPQKCHGHIIAEAVNRLDADPETPAAEPPPPRQAEPSAEARP
jgi:hypothetical protein